MTDPILARIRRDALLLRNRYDIAGLCEDDGEDPHVAERGSREWWEANRDDEWEPSEWRYEVHFSGMDGCCVVAIVPNDPEADGPDEATASAICDAGANMLYLLRENERLRKLAQRLCHPHDWADMPPDGWPICKICGIEYGEVRK